MKKFSWFLIILLIFSPVFFTKSAGVSSSDIAKEIQIKNEELAKIKSDLENTQNTINSNTKKIDEINDYIPKLDLEIELLKEEIKKNETEKKIKQTELEILELVNTENKYLLNTGIKANYIGWRTYNPFEDIVKNTSLSSLKYQSYSDVASEKYISTTKKLDEKINLAKAEIEKIVLNLGSLDSLNLELEKRISQLRTEKENYKSSLAYSKGQVTKLNDDIEQVNTQISNLTIEQQGLLKQEEEKLKNYVSTGNCGVASESGKFRFCGSYGEFGHGVGMSQWGAYDMANKGYNYSNILKFYFTGVDIVGGYKDFNINVQGYGNMNIEKYVAGLGAYGADLGEVPAKACGSKEQALSNPEKYSEYNCWPEEAIKAQAIAYRTYAVNYMNRAGEICTSTYCQYYNGKEHASWAARETEGLVITYSGVPIEALYSSNNNNGYGTADNDTVFQNYSGDGWPIPYLRAVIDYEFSSWLNHVKYFSTSTYNISDITNVINYAKTVWTYNRTSLNSFVYDNTQNFGTVTKIEMIRDASNRVKKVILTDEKNQKFQIGGAWFKILWNDWVSSESKDSDRLPGITFFAE